MSSECSIIHYFTLETKNKKISGKRHSPSPSHTPSTPRSLFLWHLPPFKILDLPLDSVTMLAAAPTLAPSLERRLEVAPATVTSAASAAPAVALAGSEPGGPWSPWSPVRHTPKSMASPVVDLAKVEGGQSEIGLLIIDSSCTLQSFSRQLAYSPVSHFT